MKSLIKLTCFSLILFLTSCSFQTSFFKVINNEFINKNLIISPLSAYQVLGLTTNGAKGRTLEEMLLALGNKNLDELNKINTNILKTVQQFSTIEIANAVMTKFNPNKGFVTSVNKYKATITTLKSLSQVNKWCSIKTKGKITKILDKLNPNTLMILLNAVYFKGEWVNTFTGGKTTKKPFYNLNSESNVVQVDTMSQKSKFLYNEDNELQIIELPYKKDSMSAIIILPKKEININNFISKLNDEKLQKLIKRMTSNEVELQLPKFELNYSSSLVNTLKKLGMNIPFGGSADFSGMRKENDIYIDEVIQKTYLKVNELGTEAAAVTAVTMVTKSIKPKTPEPKLMIVNRPFIFLLRNKKLPINNEMLFMAKIENLK